MTKNTLFAVVLLLVVSFLTAPIAVANPYAIVPPDIEIGSGAGVEGTFYIRSYEYDKYMQIDDDVSPNTSPAIIELWDLKGEEIQKWNIVHVDDYYYKIVSESSGLCLSVLSENVNEADESIVQQGYVGADRQHWEIEETSRGTVIFRPISAKNLSTDWCIAAGSGAFTSDGRNIEQREYEDDNNYNDEWVLNRIGEEVTMLSVIATEGSHDHISCYYDCIEAFQDTTTNEFNLIYTAYIQYPTLLPQIEKSKIFISRSHGSATSSSTQIQLHDEGTVGPKLASYNIYNFDTSKALVDFSNVELLLFVGCKTAYGGNNGKNLATASVNAGAGCAIGFSDSIACDGANTWTSSFCQFYANGDSVEDAADKAVEYTEDAHPILNMAGQLKVHSVVIVE